MSVVKLFHAIVLSALTLALLAGRPAVAAASPADDLTAANQMVLKAAELLRQGDLAGAKASYEQFRQRWLDIEDGIKGRSLTAYRTIEDQMAEVQFALLQNPPDTARVAGALNRLDQANQRFVQGTYPADGGEQPALQGSGGSVAELLTLLGQARQKAQSGDAAGAAQAMGQFRQSWLGVEGVVLTQSPKVYGDAEKDMVDAYAMLTASPPDLAGGLATIERMQSYLAPIADKTSYSALDAATILLREGLEALLVVVGLLAFLTKSGHADKTGWIWGGVGAGVAVSLALAVLVKTLFGVGAFGNNNFLIMGWTGIIAAAMLVWVSYWLHSKSSVAEWQRYIREQSTAALARGSLFSLAALSFLAIFREGTETVLFYLGMASSISQRDLLLGLGMGIGILVLLALGILKLGLKVPMRPFFLVSSLLVFYLGFKFTGMGIHGLQLAGVLPASIAPYLPRIEFLALYPNWQSTLPQLALLALAVAMAVRQQRRDRALRSS